MIARKKILVVEDNEINRSILKSILSSEYTVLEAENGQEALFVLQKYGEGISLILLDIIMPVMDGYTFLTHIKADSAYSSIPVIVTTQSEGESNEVAALSHGTADFVTKPYKSQMTGLYSKEFFYQRVRDILIQHPDREYDIICSDIENFKLLNFNAEELVFELGADDFAGKPHTQKSLCKRVLRARGSTAFRAGGSGTVQRQNQLLRQMLPVEKLTS